MRWLSAFLTSTTLLAPCPAAEPARLTPRDLDALVAKERKQ